MLTLTERARDALLGSQAAALRFDPGAHIRLVVTAGGLRAELVGEAAPGDAVVEADGLTLFVAPGIDGTVDAGEHNALTLIPPAG